MKRLLYLLLMWPLVYADAQECPISAISDSLLKKADAVVRYSETVFEQIDLNNAMHKVTDVTTILNEEGKGYGHVVIPLDKFRELKSFSGTVTDVSGKVIKKIGKKDLSTIAYSPHMASDDKYSYYEYLPTGYPYTIRYEYEVKIKNGIPYYPKFVPVSGYDLSVEHAKYRIRIPSDMKFRYKAERMPVEKPLVIKDAKGTIYEWSVANISAIEREPYSPGLQSIVPVVQLAPDNFCMEGQCGNMSDWNSLGSWMAKLIVGRDGISPQLKDKLLSLTANATTDKEKVQRVYKYMQSTTRYVSIQLGIGGFQPMNAADVERTGFGDCKALSNYMQSMLAAIGISSVYTGISTDKENLYPDFSNLGQMNHAILAVPMPTDTLWLECTSQTLPFNYVHTGIAGHQCLLVTPDGGEVCRVRKQTDTYNNKTRHITVSIDESGNGKAHVKTVCKMGKYEEMLDFVNEMSREEQINSLTGDLNVAKAKIGGLQIKSADEEKPYLNLEYNADIEQFANKSGNRLFVPFSLLQPVLATMNSTKRKQEIVVSEGILRTDTLQMTVPMGYTLESIPKPVTISSVFGDYSIDTKLDGNIIHIIQRIYIKKGRHPASTAEEFKTFFRNMEKESGRRTVFKVN